MAGKAGRGSDQFMIRLPDGMRDRIKASADRNSRSMNAEIVAALEESFPPLSSVSEEKLAQVLHATRNALYGTDLTEDQKDDLWEKMMAALQAGVA